MDMSLVWKAIVVAVGLTIGILTSVGLLKWKDDNPIEEIVEEGIKQYTGVDLDLTPASPENAPESQKE